MNNKTLKDAKSKHCVQNKDYNNVTERELTWARLLEDKNINRKGQL